MPTGVYVRGPKSFKQYDPAMVERIRTGRAAGRTVPEIAASEGVCVTTIVAAARRHGVAIGKALRRPPKPPTFRLPAICACGEHGFVGLTHGHVALFSPEDLGAVTGPLWQVAAGYAVRSTYVDGRGFERMHRVILGQDKDDLTDHDNRDRADNRRGNLRPCDTRLNGANRATWGASFKGVNYHKPSRLFRARITANGRLTSLGWFSDPAEAARAYDAAAIEHFGEFAATNVSLGLLPPEAA